MILSFSFVEVKMIGRCVTCVVDVMLSMAGTVSCGLMVQIMGRLWCSQGVLFVAPIGGGCGLPLSMWVCLLLSVLWLGVARRVLVLSKWIVFDGCYVVVLSGG